MDGRIKDYLEQAGLDGLFIMKGPNVRYSTNFKGADSYAFLTKDKAYLLTDPRYTEQASLECPDVEAVNWRAAGTTMMSALNEICKREHYKKVGFEADTLPCMYYTAFNEISDVELVPAEMIIEKLRSVKSSEELEYIRAACEIASRAFYRIVEDIRVGVTEKELAAKLSAYMVMEGADTQPYGNILISGANTSLLHGIPSDKAVQYGDFVLMDYGCQFHGYMSDMTRTVVVGRATGEQRKVYELEKRMLEDSLEVMKAGVETSEIYKASIKAIENTEYMQYHYTGIGHGIGLFVHEQPFISPRGGYTYEPNMVTTIEPGLYIPGWGGVRIEDQVIITEDGYENLITVSHDLVEL